MQGRLSFSLACVAAGLVFHAACSMPSQNPYAEATSGNGGIQTLQSCFSGEPISTTVCAAFILGVAFFGYLASQAAISVAANHSQQLSLLLDWDQLQTQQAWCEFQQTPEYYELTSLPIGPDRVLGVKRDAIQGLMDGGMTLREAEAWLQENMAIWMAKTKGPHPTIRLETEQAGAGGTPPPKYNCQPSDIGGWECTCYSGWSRNVRFASTMDEMIAISQMDCPQ